MPNFRFVHNNINVIDLQASMDFYGKALGLKEVRELGGARRFLRLGL